MTKTALVFAGQGAQTVGMGRDLAEQFPSAKRWFDQANVALGYDLSRVCFEGPESELTKTEHAQPGIFLVGWVAFALLRERVPTLKFEATAGLSLGEFTALTAAGAMSFEDAIRVVRQRGRFMQEACEETKGGMAAVIGPGRSQDSRSLRRKRGRVGEPQLSGANRYLRRRRQTRGRL
jgi:[acyl-carrier-protein] S-malonyltransferase